MTPDEMNSNICPSALEEDGTLNRSDAEPEWGRHKWSITTNAAGVDVRVCDECGTEKEPITKERAVMLANVVLDDFLETHKDVADVEPTNADIIEAFKFLGV